MSLNNKSHATISFTTHYCEVLDLFNRQDNNMYIGPIRIFKIGDTLNDKYRKRGCKLIL